MDDLTTKFARRAVACDNWRWVEGMLAIRTHDGARHRVTNKTRSTMDNKGWLPVINDPATKGCIRGIIRDELGGLARAVPQRVGRWAIVIGVTGHMVVADYRTEGKALVSGLEATDG